MKVGVDFGTTYSKIAYIDTHGNLQRFSFPGPPNGREFVPSAVAYLAGAAGISVGNEARSDLFNLGENDGVDYCQGFKMLLPLETAADWKENGWQHERSPRDATRDFFDHILLKSDYCFTRSLGQISSVVVSVPELWKQTARNQGTNAIVQVFKNLSLPVDHIRSEPVCAAAYYAYCYKDQPDFAGKPFNLLVCDAGGGTFDVSLCRVTGSEILVLDFDGVGQYGLGSSGLSFDRRAVEIAIENSKRKVPFGSPEFSELLNDFERVKIEKHDKITNLLAKLGPLKDRPALDDTEVYRFSRHYLVTLKQVRQAFADVRSGIVEVLNRLQERMQVEGNQIDKVAIVGGFGQFPLVEQAILETLGIAPINDSRFDQSVNRENRFYAIAMGAALIANERILPVEYYPHSLLVKAFIEMNNSTEYIPVVKSGTLAIGREAIGWAVDENGQRVIFHIERNNHGRLPVFLRLRGRTEIASLPLPEEDFPPPGAYHIGLSVDVSGLGSLLAENANTHQAYTYALGEINPTLVVEAK